MIKPDEIIAQRRKQTASLEAQAEREIYEAIRDHFDGEKVSMDEPAIDSRVLSRVLDRYRAAGWRITQATWRNETTLTFYAKGEE